MSHVENIERFLRVKPLGARGPESTAGSVRVHPFVTISRQTGAGGHALAETMLEIFSQQPAADLFEGWEVFDQKLCEVVAEDPRLRNSLESLLTEEYHSRTEEFFHQLLNPGADQSYLMDRVFRTVGMLAGVGKVIIVGRAGSEITRNMGPGFSVRLVAPVEVRIERVQEQHQLDERQARDRIRRSDSSRAKLLRRYFGVDIDDPLRYDATFNTDRVSMETIAESVAIAVRRRVEVLKP